MEPDKLAAILGLKPHPEGGFFLETYRSSEFIPTCNGDRNTSTAIYYLLTDSTYSRMHRICADEIFHFYLGDPVEQLTLFHDGTFRIGFLGNDIELGHRPQLVVPGGSWQGARLQSGGKFALLGTTVAPGFSFEDFEIGDAETLAASFPDAAKIIRSLK